MKDLLPILIFSVIVMFYIAVIPVYLFCLLIVMVASVIKWLLAQFRRNKILFNKR